MILLGVADLAVLGLLSRLELGEHRIFDSLLPRSRLATERTDDPGGDRREDHEGDQQLEQGARSKRT